jgi:hypothetical protein
MPMSAALSPFGVIDFVDNHAASHAPALGASAGPPAYLEAHGIRYVPSGSLSADAADLASEADSRAIRESLVSMGSDAAPPVRVSQQDLDSRVAESIRKFYDRSGGSGIGSRAGSSRYDDDLDLHLRSRMRSRARELDSDWDSGLGSRVAQSEVSEHMRALRREMDAESAGSGRKKGGGLRPELDAEWSPAERARLRNLSRECQAAADRTRRLTAKDFPDI